MSEAQFGDLNKDLEIKEKNCSPYFSLHRDYILRPEKITTLLEVTGELHHPKIGSVGDYET